MSSPRLPLGATVTGAAFAAPAPRAVMLVRPEEPKGEK
jgi:hypothetical protein